MMPSHHPNDELLMEYAAGSLPEPVSLVVATHLALCPNCRRAVAQFEAVGGAMLDDLDPLPLESGSLEAILARLDEPAPPEPRRAKAPPKPPAAPPPVFPEPLRSYAGCDLPSVPWRPVIRGIEEFELPLRSGPIKTRLMRIQPGLAMPRHTHRGIELTLVLAGGFRDAGEHFLRGDIEVSDSSVDHQPVADDDGECVCLAVTDAPLRLTGPIGRLLNPFVRF